MAQLGYRVPPTPTSPPDAWGPPGVFARRLHGTTPVQTGPDPLASPDNEEDYVSYYQGRIAATQIRQLLPLQEDLADWLNKILNIDCLTATNLLDMLDNGVILIHLARLIQQKAQECVLSGVAKGPVPGLPVRCFEKAARRSFYSRDNMENFITFCRKLGVHQHLLFESDDLVLQANPRHVILCLLEVSRIASRYNVEPPGLVQLEREIAAEEEGEGDSGLSQSSWHSPSPDPEPLRHSTSVNIMNSDNAWESDVIHRAASEDGTHSETTSDEWSRGSPEDPEDEVEVDPRLNELDRKVKQATRVAQKLCHCPSDRCQKLKIKKIGEGKYCVAGRNVFIRLLKGRHMMVRVGGGWDTLEHFLARHDPCQSQHRHPPSSPRTPSSSSVSRTSSPLSRNSSPSPSPVSHIPRATSKRFLAPYQHSSPDTLVAR
uniref:GAS2-like protein 1 n=1 Tax=Cacopsylla melanoneura TaxID=428564 RepID=A0A8D8ZW67_9HEMI